MAKNNREVIIIGGPTASGKSTAALNLAISIKNGIIINADSLQVYKDLPILTAQPTLLENKQSSIPHKLYGFVEYNEQMNATKWAKLAAQCINEAFLNGETPILVGGSGMYIKGLMEGFSPLPDINQSIREEAVALSKRDYSKLCDKVYQNDNTLKNTITTDKNRQMIRAYEILLQTGKSIRHFFEQPKVNFLKDVSYNYYLINCDRETIYNKINIRFKKMIDNGAINEVKTLLNKTSGSKNYPVFQAIGALEICNYLDSNYSIDEVIEISCTKSRRYAKRQITWFKNQVKNARIL